MPAREIAVNSRWVKLHPVPLLVQEEIGGVDAGRPVVVGVSGGQVSEGQTEAKPTGPCANPEREHRLIR